jgi:hypothetical protein
VLEDGGVVGRIFLSSGAPQERPWMWASGHNGHITWRRRPLFIYGISTGCSPLLAAGAKSK